MADEIKEALLYDFNYHLFVAKTMLPNVRNVEDRQTVFKWLTFFKNNAKTLQEMKLRNEFMFRLVQSVQAGVISSPFDNPPPNVPLMSMIGLLPEDDEEDENDSPDDSKPCKNEKRMSGIMRRSPDAGEFLAAQPIPDVGAFCYVAVLTKNNN